ncbi:putative ATP synthase subunit b [uncultured Desulfatiglans sp.]|nr:putative ATP synthase subunit b [uncultured Desulfatiglans sp.]
MISINATLIAQVVHFLVLMYILKHLMILPIWNLIKARQEHMEKAQNDILEAEQKAIELAERYMREEEKAIRAASKERNKLREEAISEAMAEYDQAQATVSSIRAKVTGEVERELAEARPSLRDHAVALVDEIIPKVLGRRIEA